MPSQEDKKDKLTERIPGGAGEGQALDIDAVSEMSQEEIERLLARGAEEDQARQAGQPEEEDQKDVLEMMEEAQDDNLWDIQDMLKKSDRNEAIDEDAEGDEDSLYGDSPADKLLADIEGANEEAALDGKARKALEKQRKAEEKARQREEKSARKKAAKEAARAEREAKKGLKKKGGGKGKEETAEKEEIQEYDLLLDKELLDSIVSDAGNLGEKPVEGKTQEPRPDGMDRTESRADALGGEYGPDAFGLQEDDSMEGDSRMGQDTSGKGSGLDIMEVDMDEVDAFIPDVSDSMKEGKDGKKKGFMSKLIDMLTEEDDSENEDIQLSKENQEIIRDLDEEMAAGKGGKKKKKAKKPAKKKEKPKKAPKPAKPPKPKKPKKPKETESYVPSKKITFRKALPILLLGATIGAVTFIFVNLASDFSVKRAALDAYDQKDYQTCYQKLYGRKLNEEEERMYGQSECVLYLRQRYHKYELFLGQGAEAEALDSLIQTIGSYPGVLGYASQWEILPEVGEAYSAILGILQDEYGITEEQAQAIAAVGSDIQYTRIITDLVEGKGYGSPEGNPPSEEGVGSLPEDAPEEGMDLPDELPEETEIEDGNFTEDQ